MSNLQVIHYNGPKAEYKYAHYNKKFWKTLCLQSWMYQLGISGSVRNIIWSKSRKRQRNISVSDQLLPIEVKERLDGDFRINGRNETDIISGLETLMDLPIDEIERRMLPDDRMLMNRTRGEYDGSSSGHGGFIKPGESLLGIMAMDNITVLRMGYTHQEVAKPMLQIINAWLRYGRDHFLHIDKPGFCILCFNLNGKEFRSELRMYAMFQDSPFNDGISVPGYDIGVTNVITKAYDRFSILSPFLIHRYGFYEGDVRYRIEPRKAIEFYH